VYTVFTRKVVFTIGCRRSARLGSMVVRMISGSHQACMVASARPHSSHAAFSAPAELPYTTWNAGSSPSRSGLASSAAARHPLRARRRDDDVYGTLAPDSIV
jgi:hypothetical protein